MERESREERERERERENLMKRSEKIYLKKKIQSYNSSVYLHTAKM